MKYKNELLLRTLRAAGIKRLKYVFCKYGVKVISFPSGKTNRLLSRWNITPEQESQLSRLVWNPSRAAIHLFRKASDRVVHLDLECEPGQTELICKHISERPA